jgi:hypothetical protein
MEGASVLPLAVHFSCRLVVFLGIVAFTRGSQVTVWTPSDCITLGLVLTEGLWIWQEPDRNRWSPTMYGSSERQTLNNKTDTREDLGPWCLQENKVIEWDGVPAHGTLAMSGDMCGCHD